MMAINYSSMPASVKLMEVAPRDGLQNEKQLVDTKSKIRFIESLVDAGIKRIEVTAFVSPQWIPPLADQLEVALGVSRKPGVSYAALVPNVRGYERAMNAHIDEVSVVVAASNTHNQKNLNGDTDKVMERYREVAKRAQEDARPFRAYISCAFGCPYEGKVPVSSVLSLATELLDLGAYEVAISDTIGMASPLSTIAVLEAALKTIAREKIALHLHDTRGLALANIFSALTLGISSFDSSAGGMGGCPYAPGASGNVATEDLVYMLEAMGISTGVSLEKLSSASLAMEGVLKKHLPSKLLAVTRSMRT
jgi:hydroxymethylglutaryl-CoA lyase